FFSKYPRGKTGAIQLVSSQANAIGRSRTGSGQPGWYPGELRQHHATPSEFFAPRFRQVRPPQAADRSSGQPSLPLPTAIILNPAPNSPDWKNTDYLPGLSADIDFRKRAGSASTQ